MVATQQMIAASNAQAAHTAAAAHDTVEADPVELPGPAGQALAVIEEERYRASAPPSVLPSPQEWNAAMAFAREISDTTFVPGDYRGNPAAVLAGILFGRELGLGPMQSLRQVHVIDGRPALAAELMLAKMRQGGVRLLETTSTSERAYIRAERADTGEVAEVEWTTADAQTAGLLHKKNWKAYPADMLWSRCVGRLARRLGSDLLSGMVYAAEEVRDWTGTDSEIPYSETLAVTAPAAPPGLTLTEEAKAILGHADGQWAGIHAALNQAEPGMPWEAWIGQALVAITGTDKAGYRSLTAEQKRECVWRVANGVVRVQTAKFEKGEFPPLTRSEIQRAFAATDSVGEILDGPDVPLDPDEANEWAAREKAAADADTSDDGTVAETTDAPETAAEEPTGTETEAAADDVEVVADADVEVVEPVEEFVEQLPADDSIEFGPEDKP